MYSRDVSALLTALYYSRVGHFVTRVEVGLRATFQILQPHMIDGIIVQLVFYDRYVVYLNSKYLDHYHSVY